jgi:hypothetical protein
LFIRTKEGSVILPLLTLEQEPGLIRELPLGEDHDDVRPEFPAAISTAQICIYTVDDTKILMHFAKGSI